MTSPLADRLYTKVRLDDDTGCWEWTGFRTPGGYGLIRPGGPANHILAHRASYELSRGPIPDGPHGHQYTPENTRVYRGRRHCRACDRQRLARRRQHG